MHKVSELLTELMPSGLKDRIRGAFGDYLRFKQPPIRDLNCRSKAHRFFNIFRTVCRWPIRQTNS